MKNSVKHLLWFLLAPFMFLFEPQPWYKKAALLLLSPAMLLPLPAVLLIYYTLDAATQAYTYDVEHQYKNATELAAVTHTPIPACDTLGAVHDRWKWFESITEDFELRHPLTEEEEELLRTACTQSPRWTETDSTFVYNPIDCYINNPEMWPDWEYSSFSLTISKKDQQMTLYYEYRNSEDYPKSLRPHTDR